VTARRHGRLVGCAVFISGGKGATLVDLFGVHDRAVLGALMEAVISLPGAADIRVSM
jgi:hypothetical protein